MENTQKEKIDLGATEKWYEIEKNKYNWKQDKDY